ncbi:hypothetical protein [Haladaptatus sp. W1]|uniref:hypothetical protein n=1 Tax=Haladaptatus sp. W1 TaxID=1897478 RepID=UPI0009F42879|nr:hypothetical protein [Haladaptatus sp. W1]
MAVADSVSAMLYEIAGWLMVGFGSFSALGAIAALLEHGDAVPAVILTVVAFLFLTFGVAVNPSLRRKIARRRGLSGFGRVSSVDDGVIHPDEDCRERCVACDSRVNAGVERRFREEFVVAGLPVTTLTEGYNHYCLDCASEEILGLGRTNADARRGDRESNREDELATDR